jgi:hypothetical protein
MLLKDGARDEQHGIGPGAGYPFYLIHPPFCYEAFSLWNEQETSAVAWRSH